MNPTPPPLAYRLLPRPLRRVALFFLRLMAIATHKLAQRDVETARCALDKARQELATAGTHSSAWFFEGQCRRAQVELDWRLARLHRAEEMLEDLGLRPPRG